MKGPSVESSKVAEPDRRCIQGTVAHLRFQVLGGECFPFHVADNASCWQSQFESVVEAAAPRTDADDSEAGISHISHALCAAARAAFAWR